MYLRAEDLLCRPLDAFLGSLIIESSADEDEIMKRAARLSFNHELTFSATRPKKRGRLLFGALVLLLIAGGLGYVLAPQLSPLTTETASSSTNARPTTQPQEPATAPAPQPPHVVETDIAYVVRPKDTLGEIFSQLKLDVNQIPAILEVPMVRDRFKPLQPGDRLTFSLENGALRRIDRRISETEILSIVLGDHGFAAEVTVTPIEKRMAHVRGTIASSRFVPGRVIGLSPVMIQQFANNIFGWDIDFALDVRPGDRFNIVYEQKFRGDEYLGDGNIVAAEFINDGEVHRAVRYTSPDNKIDDYFTPDGHVVRRQFLRTPLDFTRVNANVDPKGRELMLSLTSEHEGVDYPAPVGTVVKAVGDGRIESIGVNGAYGNVVLIEHDGTTSTLYAHLSAFERGMQPDQRVKQGDAIGYVGSSGAATAPHLHYEFRVNGSHTDPGTVEPPVTASIPAEYRADLQSASLALLRALQQPGDTVVTAVLVTR